MGIFELPNMMNPDGTMGNILVAFAGIAISMAAGFVLTLLVYRDKKEAVPVKAASGNIVVASPLKGKVLDLSEVKDEAFSSGVLGKGAAIEPEEGVLYASVDGTISAFFPTGHAVGITMDTGLELLIHVGMDTVQLNGKGFQPLAAAGDFVKQGQKLLEFDMKLIREAGYSLVTPVLVTNPDDFAQVEPSGESRVQAGDTLLMVL